MAAEAALHREHDRPPSVGPKRMREWEDEPAVKKPASEENRARLEDLRHRRPSTPPRDPYRRSSSEQRRNIEEQHRIEERRFEEQRREDVMRRLEEQQRHATEAYHPSEAAHHPPAHSMPGQLPPMQQGPSPMQGIIREPPPPAAPGPKDYPVDERRLEHPAAPQAPINEPERAARKMDVDEDYDDSGEDEKKGPVTSGPASGPGSTSGDIKNSTPTGSAINGMINGPKVESS